MSEQSSGKSPQKEQKAVLVLPNLGLSESEIETLKDKFRNNVIESMGGPDALKSRDVVIVVVVVIVEK